VVAVKLALQTLSSSEPSESEKDKLKASFVSTLGLGMSSLQSFKVVVVRAARRLQSRTTLYPQPYAASATYSPHGDASGVHRELAGAKWVVSFAVVAQLGASSSLSAASPQAFEASVASAVASPDLTTLSSVGINLTVDPDSIDTSIVDTPRPTSLPVPRPTAIPTSMPVKKAVVDASEKNAAIIGGAVGGFVGLVLVAACAVTYYRSHAKAIKVEPLQPTSSQHVITPIS